MATQVLHDSKGLPVGLLRSRYLFGVNGKWLGFLGADNTVFTPTGEYLGVLLDDGRVVTDPSRYGERAPIPPAPPTVDMPKSLPRVAPKPKPPSPLRDSFVPSRDFLLAAKIFDVASLVLPRRVADEVLGDSLEYIHELVSRDAPRWRIYLKIISTCFWVTTHSFRELFAVLIDRPSVRGRK